MPKTMSLNPADASLSMNGHTKKTKLRTVATVSAELKEAKERISYLEAKLKKNGISY